jgi:hypothetical protein
MAYSGIDGRRNIKSRTNALLVGENILSLYEWEESPILMTRM